jgi:uncharacterized protein
MAAAAKDSRLKNRTLTKLYNERPTWLKVAHETLDRAVLAAYSALDPMGGWEEDWALVWVETGAGQPLPIEHPLRKRRSEVDQLVLSGLLKLNRIRAGATQVPHDAPTSTPKTSMREKPVGDENLVKAMSEYRDGLRELYKDEDRLERVVLFGSRARGDAQSGSDADIMVVLRRNFSYDKEIKRTSKLTAEISLKYGVRINRGFISKTAADPKEGLLQDNVRREGIEL